MGPEIQQARSLPHWTVREVLGSVPSTAYIVYIKQLVNKIKKRENSGSRDQNPGLPSQTEFSILSVI